MSFLVDILFFFTFVFVCYFFWRLIGADFCGGLRRRRSRRPSRNDDEQQNAIVSIQREILREQLQQDVHDHLRMLQWIQEHNQNTATSANPEAAAEELAKLKLERRKQIRFQLMTRDYQEDDDDDHDEEEIDDSYAVGNNAATPAANARSNVPEATGAGAPEDQIASVTRSSPRKQRRQQGGATCNICLCDYEPGEDIAKGPICHHDFHTECIIDWLLRNEQCPICRQDFLTIHEPPPALPEIQLMSSSSSSSSPSSPSLHHDNGDAELEAPRLSFEPEELPLELPSRSVPQTPPPPDVDC